MTGQFGCSGDILAKASAYFLKTHLRARASTLVLAGALAAGSFAGITPAWAENLQDALVATYGSNPIEVAWRELKARGAPSHVYLLRTSSCSLLT